LIVETFGVLPEQSPVYDTGFDIGFDLSDEQFMAAACGAVQDIVALYDVLPDEGGLSNEEIFGRLQGVFDATSQRFSAELSRKVEAQMGIMAAIGHAACGNEELMGGFLKLGMIDGSTAQKHEDHPKGSHNHEDDEDEDEDD
jgi:hypothetical protein